MSILRALLAVLADFTKKLPAGLINRVSKVRAEQPRRNNNESRPRDPLNNKFEGKLPRLKRFNLPRSSDTPVRIKIPQGVQL